MPTILSTKKLALNQKMLLLNASVSLVEYDAIQIEALPFKISGPIKNAIITSQNAILSIQNSVQGLQEIIQNCFCVGSKTKLLLEKNGYTVIKMTEYASQLAEYIIKNHVDDHFHFFCGTIRSDEIPVALSENKISFEEIKVYKTSLNHKNFERNFDAVLFFSPSGVRSFFESQTNITVAETKFVCIGNTTAAEAEKYTANVLIANATTIESVIAKAVKYLKTVN